MTPLPEGPLSHHQKWQQGVRTAPADWAVNQVPMPPIHARDGGLNLRPAEEAGFPGGAPDVWESQATLWTPLFCPRGHCSPERPRGASSLPLCKNPLWRTPGRHTAMLQAPCPRDLGPGLCAAQRPSSQGKRSLCFIS